MSDEGFSWKVLLTSFFASVLLWLTTLFREWREEKRRKRKEEKERKG